MADTRTQFGKDHHTLLFQALDKGDLERMKWLDMTESFLQQKNANGLTPLAGAAYKERGDIFQYLLFDKIMYLSPQLQKQCQLSWSMLYLTHLTPKQFNNPEKFHEIIYTLLYCGVSYNPASDYCANLKINVLHIMVEKKSERFWRSLDLMLRAGVLLTFKIQKGKRLLFWQMKKTNRFI